MSASGGNYSALARSSCTRGIGVVKAPPLEDVDDADRLGRVPAMRWIVGGKAVERGGASTSQMGRFETELLAIDENLAALAEIPVAGIEECERGYETVVATLHRNAVVLTVRGDTSPTRLWPIRVHYKQLAAGISYNPWLVDFQFESPIQIVQAPQLLENGFATLKRLYWTGRDELPSGPLVRLCVDHSEKRRFGGGRYYRIVSYKVLD